MFQWGLLQPKNQALLKVAYFVARLRDALRAALAIGDTTQAEKFAEAKTAWDDTQRLLLEATSVEGLVGENLDLERRVSYSSSGR